MNSRIFYNENKIRQAIALFYDQVDAPKIIAKGEGDIARRMIMLAKQHNIHLHEDPNLLKQFSQLNIGDTIPEELYQVIAEIISFVYWLEGKTPQNKP
ncbi:MAG: hypothetical protein COW84_05480 [Gammaproteobacteria bacterium CG22_combo_CG10-13_8_21_14_all_40_8]|nr:MAG: hypothetical protein COW84_05480 [Gammaproteobacteria bacterium CG22_combo_CG10-13_8_21_14_all_40_8]